MARRTTRTAPTTTNTENPVNAPQTPVQTPEKPTVRKRVAPAEIAFTVADTANATFVPQTKGGNSRERSDYQKSIDALVKTNYGKPFVAVEIDMSEDAVKDFTRRIRYSSEFLKLGVRLGELQPSKNTGKVVFTFRVTDRIARPRKPKPVAE